MPKYPPPSILTSFVYLDAFLRQRDQHEYHIRDWVLDSGAYSAHNSGKSIDLQEFIDTALRLLEEDPTLTEVFGLDVIGDWEATNKNVEEMWRQGVPAIPTYHIGEPEEYLLHIAKEYPKIALGGVARMPAGPRIEWARQCFHRVWPTRIHGFGFGGKKDMISLPWDSVDSASWEMKPGVFGIWHSYNNAPLKIRGTGQDLRVEVEHFLELEHRARIRWTKTLREEFGEDHPGPTFRFVDVGSGRGPKAFRRMD